MPFVTEGLNHYNDVVLHGSSQVTTWYVGLFDDTSYTEVADGDTLASHSGWTEFTGYSGDRKEWTEGAASDGVTTNAQTVDFTMTEDVTVKGWFICSAASGTSGTLLAAEVFDEGDAELVTDQVLQVTITLTSQDGG